MQEIFNKYLSNVSEKFSHEETSEMGYRSDFELLLNEIFENIHIRGFNKRIDHDARAKEGKKPDFVLLNGEIPILYIETKDIGISLDKVEESKQGREYRFGYENFVLTDYIEFRFYRNGSRYQESIRVGELDFKDRTIRTLPQNYEFLAQTLIQFTQSHKEPIKSATHLSKIMAGKALRIRDNIKEYLKEGTEVAKVYEMIKKSLVSDLSLDSFADMYAQTLVYGLFAARYNDESEDNFTRQEARDLVPKSNPLLRHFFDHITGADFDKRLEYIVDELCEVFSYSDVKKLLESYYEKEDGKDPIIHFYEDFLQEYDPVLRKKMGAYYTPLPVVNFIVRSVDEILKKDFNFRNGLADTSKMPDGKHVVQVLDPATGTGTFISAVINLIYKRLLDSDQKGRWAKYVHHDLLPRIHAFELMMAPYTITHLKLSIAFRKTGFIHFNRRLGVYLTNALEEGIKQEDLFSIGFAESIAEESKEAEKIKKDTPVMVVIGNPPYSGESSNKGSYAMSLVEKYKYEPGGKERLKEKNPKWINDDYVKFIALAEEYIRKNKTGVVGFITNHGYLDNPTFRGMRWNLLKTFDEIYVIDLHGNIKKKEVSPDGSKDENVFDIQQGVAILLGIKTNKKKENELGLVYRFDMWGSREKKFEFLEKSNLKKIPFKKLVLKLSNNTFKKQNYVLENKYIEGFEVNKLFKKRTIGIVTSRDVFVIDEDMGNLISRIKDFYASKPVDIEKTYGLRSKLNFNIEEILSSTSFDAENIKKISYRPFDDRYIYYKEEFVERTRYSLMRNLINMNDNVSLLIKRQGKQNFSYIFLTNKITESCMFESAYANNTVCPLYLCSDDGTKTPNLNSEIVSKIENIVGKCIPEDILDYIYAVLHSPKYREKYKEFLKIDFPRVPYPKNKETFRKLVKIGTQLRQLHLMESPKLNRYITTYPKNGSDKVEKVIYENGNVYINDKQYFGNVPEIAWNFYIGGYQPAQKWLKDRKRRTLTNEDLEHYQKIIIVLNETEKMMREIDNTVNFD